MEKLKNTQSTDDDIVQYKYIVKCKDKNFPLDVDNNDVIYNADGEIDCPFDAVLRKNKYTLEDLMTLEAQELHFVKIENQVHIPINSVSLKINL